MIASSSEISCKRPTSIPWILAGGLLSISISPILVRLASDAPPMAIAVWRTVFAVLFLLPFSLGRTLREIKQLSRMDMGLIVGAGVALGFHFITWIESLYLTSVASASVLVSTSPIFLAVLGFFLLKERITNWFILALILAVVGAVCIGIGDFSQPVVDGRHPWLGNGLATTAALLVSIYLLIGRIVRQKVSWTVYVFPLYVVVALTCLAVAAIEGVPLFGYSWQLYGLFVVMAIFPQIFGHGSFNLAVKYYKAALLGILTLTEPVGASIIAYFLFGEIPGWLAIIGMIIVLAAICIVMLERLQSRPANG